MRVWISRNGEKRRTKFHRTPSCPEYGRVIVGEEVDLIDVVRPDPCYRCFPYAPRQPKLLRRWCPECNDERVFPCRHNGGVLVKVPFERSHRGYRLRYVWPDNAHRYEIVDDLVQS